MKLHIKAVSSLLAAVALLFLAPHAATAVPLDLTTAGSSGTINLAIFSTTDLQPTGTGVIQPFLRLQGGPDETGLNSDEGNADLLADTKAGLWTNDLVLGSLGTTMIGGVEYYTFLLDINQTNSKPLLSLDTVQFYTRGTSITDGNPDTVAVVQAGGTLRYDMDAAPDGPTWVMLNYALNPGSGGGDMFLYVPTSNFAGSLPTDFVYLHTQFGLQGDDYASNSGFEEWAAMSATQVPDGATTVLLLGGALLALPFFRRYFR